MRKVDQHINCELTKFFEENNLFLKTFVRVDVLECIVKVSCHLFAFICIFFPLYMMDKPVANGSDWLSDF